MKKLSLLFVAVCAAVLTSCQSTRQQQSANVYAPNARDIVVNMNGQQEARKKSPGNTAQIASQRRDDVTLVGAPAPVVRRSSGSVGASYRRPAPPSAPVPTGRHITGYHVERRWSGGHVTIPPGTQPIGGGVVRHWHGWGEGPDGSREGEVIQSWGYQGGHVPWGAGSSSSTTVHRFGYGN